jgi:hypothetical protein
MVLQRWRRPAMTRALVAITPKSNDGNVADDVSARGSTSQSVSTDEVCILRRSNVCRNAISLSLAPVSIKFAATDD